MSSGRVDKGSLTNKTKEKFQENVYTAYTDNTVFTVYAIQTALQGLNIREIVK